MKAGARTRDCLDPWTTVYVKATGDVAPCCWSGPIGNLADEPIEHILEGEAALLLRRQLLSGELPADCRACPARDWVDPRELEGRVRGLARENARRQRLEALGGVPRDQARLLELRAKRDELLRERERLEEGRGSNGREALDARLVALEREMIAIERGLGRLSYRLRKPVRWLLRRAWSRARRGAR